MERKYRVFRYIAFSLEYLLLFVIQATPFLLPEILGGKPLLLLPAALTIAFMEDEIPAMFFGTAAGIMLDFGLGQAVGFFTVTLTIICFVTARIFREYMVVSFLNATAFISAITTGLIILYFLLFFVLAGKPHALVYFASHYISRVVYTIVCGVGLYFLNKFLYKNLR